VIGGAQSSTGSVTAQRAGSLGWGASRTLQQQHQRRQGAFECDRGQPELAARRYSQHQCSRCIDRGEYLCGLTRCVRASLHATCRRRDTHRVDAATALVLTVNVALLAPAATVTLEGTLAALVLLLESATAPHPREPAR